MKFARYDDGIAPRAGVLGEDERLHPLASGPTVEALIERGGLEALLAAGTAALAAEPGPPVADVRLLAPLRPASIRDSVSFEAHIEGARRSQEGATDPVPARWYEAPCFYFTNPHACIGAFDDVQRFPGSELFDLECEVGVVYGAHGRNLTPE
jgi:2-keto-4-pentenoate hydratase/2-oxohepta-3-ene-1,7-dioic acid hydratase in catechol pathway